MARYEAYWSGSVEENGMDSIVVARMRRPGEAEIGVFLIDAWCLGVKDANYIPDGTEDELRELVRERLPGGGESIDPADARKLIEGAEAFAAKLGFAPARDYRKARRVLGGIDAARSTRAFTFGCEGRPKFVAGPDDSPDRIERVLGILRARCGEGGFDYVELDDDDGQEALEASANFLRDTLDAANPPAPSFRELCGIMAAIVVNPQINESLPQPLCLFAERFLPELQEEERDAFLLAATLQVGRTMDDFITALDDPPEKANPIQLVDVALNDKADGIEFLVEWACGFMRAQELWPEAWQRWKSRVDLEADFALVAAWAHPEKFANLALIRRENAAGRSLSGVVLTLFKVLRREG